MLQSIKGIYRDGKVELLESPGEIRRAQVIVTFLDAEITAPGEAAKTRKSLIDSGEILADDLTHASAEIAAAFNRAAEKSALELEN